MLLCYIWLGCQELDHPAIRDYITEDPFAFLRHFAQGRHVSELPDLDEDSKGCLSLLPLSSLGSLWRGYFVIVSSK